MLLSYLYLPLHIYELNIIISPTTGIINNFRSKRRTTSKRKSTSAIYTHPNISNGPTQFISRSFHLHLIHHLTKTLTPSPSPWTLPPFSIFQPTLSTFTTTLLRLPPLPPSPTPLRRLSTTIRVIILLTLR